MTEKKLIRGHLVLPHRTIQGGYLEWSDGKISGIYEADNAPHADDLLDVGDNWVLPGLVDAHVHAYSYQADPERLDRLTQGAATGGVTTVIDMPYDAPMPVIHVERLHEKIAALQREAVVDVALYGTVQKFGGWSQIVPLAQAGVCAFKFSTYESDPGRFPEIPDAELIKAFGELGKVRLPAAFHAENSAIIDPLIEEYYAIGEEEPRAHAWSRPPVSETTAVLKLLELARTYPIKLHIAHLTVPDGYDMVHWFRQLGVDATAETCIQYLVLDESDLSRRHALAKCNPPVRTKAMQESLWQKLLAGEIDFVTSDHAPWPKERKQNPNIFDNGSGLPGVQTLAPLFFSEGVVKRNLDIRRYAHLLAAAPAQRFGLYPRKGVLQIGADADIAIIDPTQTWIVDGATQYSGAGWSPFEGLEISGAVTHTFVRGQLVFDGNGICAAPGFGEFVRPVH